MRSVIIGITIGATTLAGAATTFATWRDERLGASRTLQNEGAPEYSGQFHFARAVYSAWRGPTWSIDYPAADRHFVIGLERLTNIDAYDGEHPIDLTDPELRKHPFLYAVEVGSMELSVAEVEGLRGYLLAGGFLVIDDFWGSLEWRTFESQMRKVLPGYPIVEMAPDHPIFSAFYDVEEILQVPALSRGVNGIPTWERDGFVPHVRGIFDESGRLMVIINWNTDLGDAWEHADHPAYPLEYSTYAYRMGVNFIVYALTH